MKTLYSNGDTTRNVYSASGEKLKSVHATGVEYALSSDGDVLPPDLSADAFAGLETIEYRGPLVYHASDYEQRTGIEILSARNSNGSPLTSTAETTLSTPFILNEIMICKQNS